MANDRFIKPTPAPSILVAELEPISRMSLSELLREEGYHVVEAADSNAAITHLCRERGIRIILVDLEMPSWASIIGHACANLPQSFILGMVRYGSLSNALQAERLGAHAHLIKPLIFKDVNQWIQSCLTGQSIIKPD